MDLRANLTRQQSRITYIAAVPAFAAMLAFYFLCPKPVLTITEQMLVVLVVSLSYSVPLSYFIRKVRCYECNFSYGFMSLRQKKKDQVNFCPGCGLSMEKTY